MLISCLSCYSKYLVNSADLKPNGRTVECAKCGNKWHQEAKVDHIEENNEFILSTNSKKIDNKSNLSPANLPSTYVHKQKFSILNSVLVILFITILFIGFIVFRNIEINTLVLLSYYIEEFYFNLKLIINDIAILIHQIIN